MARTILYTTGLLLALLLSIVTASALVAAATPVLTVTQGERVSITIDTRFGSDPDANEITVSAPSIGIYRNTALSNSHEPVIVESFIADAAPGSYAMSVRIGRNGETLRFTQYTLTILPKGTQSSPATTATNTITRIASGPTPSGIRIEPIPDLLPGESFVLPVTFTGTGTYTVEIPNLDFARYELANPITAHGTTTVPVLIELNDDLAPGTYVIPVTIGTETTSARVRVISYHRDESSLLIGIGIALIIIALVILLVRFVPLPRAPPPRNPPQPPRDTTENADELITYY